MTEENRRQYTDDDLLEYLIQYAEGEGQPPTSTEFQSDESVPSVYTYHERFGSWSSALEAAGFDSRNRPYSEEELLENLRDLSDELGRTPSSHEMDAAIDRPYASTYKKVFGSWADAIEEAGFDPTKTGAVDGASRGGLNRERKPLRELDAADSPMITEGATIEATFPGDPATVRAIQTSEEWGVVATDVDPVDAVEIEHMTPSDGSTWTVLRTLLLEMADADCQPTQMLDYLAIDKCGIEPAEWAQRRETMTQTVEKSAGHARTKLAGEESGAPPSSQS